MRIAVVAAWVAAWALVVQARHSADQGDMVLDATDASTERLAGEQHPFQATTGLLNRVLDDDERSLFSCGGKGAQIGDVASRTAAFDLAELPEDGDCCLLAIRNGDKSLPFFDWLTASFMTISTNTYAGSRAVVLPELLPRSSISSFCEVMVDEQRPRTRPKSDGQPAQVAHFVMQSLARLVDICQGKADRLPDHESPRHAWQRTLTDLRFHLCTQ